VSGEDILVHYGLQNLSHLTEEHLVTVCPALLNQAVLPPCSTEPPVLTDPCHHRPTYDVNQLILKAENDGMDVPHEIKLKAVHLS